MPHRYLLPSPTVERPPAVSSRTRLAAAALVASMVAASGCHLLLGYEEERQELQPGPTTSSSQGGAGMQGGGGAGGSGANGAGGNWGCRDVAEDAFAAMPPLGPADERFTSPQVTLDRWGARFFVTNEGGYAGASPCKATLCPGELQLLAGEPNAIGAYAWYSSAATPDQSGPIIYQRITGDFAIEVDVEVTAMGAMPDYSGAGIIVRNPSSSYHFVYYSLAMRIPPSETEPVLSTQAVVRYPEGTLQGGHSSIPAGLVPASTTRGRLLLCRIGGAFSFHRRLANEDEPTVEEVTTADLGFDGVSELEVGFGAHWFRPAGAPFRGTFRHARFTLNPAGHAGCLALLE